MYDIGDFIELLEANFTYPFVLPTRAIRPKLPYINITPIISNVGDIYQRVIHKASIDIAEKNINEQVFSGRRSQFSITAISNFDPQSADTGAELELAEFVIMDIQNFMKTQKAIDFFRGRAEVLRIISPVTVRNLIEDNFDEARYGFDIQVNDRVIVTETKEFIDILTLDDTTDKIDDIVINL